MLEIGLDNFRRVGIKRYDLTGLKTLMHTMDEPAYRAEQLASWLYARGADSYDAMTNLPAALRARLAACEPIAAPLLVDRQVSADGTRKYLLELADGARVEAVGLPSETPSPVPLREGARHGGEPADRGRMADFNPPLRAADRHSLGGGHTDSARLTVCFSTQVGCNMACRFCATGKLGLTRSLAPGEIVDQVLCVARDFGLRVTNAVAMGEGEPFATYDTTLGALRILNAPEGVGLGIGARHLTVSTCGLLPGIKQLSVEPEQFTLAVSLHSAVQKTRDYLLPRLSGSPLEQLRAALLIYAEKTGRRPTLEYAPIKGVNDTDTEIAALVVFCRKLLCHVNLIPLNPGDEYALKPSPATRVREIERRLTEAHIECTVRRSRGADILGACGQLAGR